MRRFVRIRRRARRLQGLIWLLGLAFLAITGRWWPGILILVAISVIFGIILRERTAEEIRQAQPGTWESAPEVVPAPPLNVEPVKPAPAIHQAERLPLSCPKCGAPTRAEEVQWTGNASAACSYCGSNLPMNKI